MSEGRVVCFGEVMARLAAPGRERLLQTPRLEVTIGGAEANVAVSLARFGHSAAMVTMLPDNPLGRAARDELRRHGVDTAEVRLGPGRMGLYFLAAGAMSRPSEVTYDRAGSAFALASPEAVDWERALRSAARLHLSGITPALSPAAAEAAVRAAREARRLGVAVSFDGNFRPSLWSARGGDPAPVLRSLLECADVAFVDDRDIARILGRSFDDVAPAQRRRVAAAAAFEVFPTLQHVASTERTQRTIDDQDLSAVLFTRAAEHRAGPQRLSGVVDRIGAGDAFAAGLLHGLASGWADERSLAFALAAAALKHSIPGDFNLVDEDEVLALLEGAGLDVKR